MNGTDLLAEFRKTRAEASFGELVRRYTNLVYSVAKRRLGNGSLAEEATQLVFIRLAKAVPQIRGDAELVAWLHRTAIHASIDLWRSESRRRAREESAAAMQLDNTQPDNWNLISPILDEALNELTDSERETILLRYFEQKSMRDLGAAFGISEDAAKMRVSRAMDRLRTVFARKGVACGAATLAALLAERAVEAAPSGLILSLATMKVPAAAAGAGAGLAGVMAKLLEAKWLVGAAATALIITAVVVSRRPATASNPTDSTEAAGAPAPQRTVTRNESATTAASIAKLALSEIKPRELLEGVARARNRVYSGEMEFEVSRYELDRPLDGTNVTRVRTRFDGTKRWLESWTREYAIISMEPNASEMVAARRKAERLDHEGAVRAGLIKPFESHHVMAYDGSVLMDYWEDDGRPQGTRIADPKQGGFRLFDPRCLGLVIGPSVSDTIETALELSNTNAMELIGEEMLDGNLTWHLCVRGGMKRDFWLDKTHPVRVLKYEWNGSTITAVYDSRDLRDPLPLEVTELFLHGTFGNQTAFSVKRIQRRSARINLTIDPVCWTLAGLGMKIGTDVSDDRIFRRLGYWTGTELSESLPVKQSAPTSDRQNESGAGPNRTELLAVLETEPESRAGLAAARWIIINTPDGPEVAKAADVILREHLRDTNLVQLCVELERLRHRCAMKLLTELLRRNPSAAVKGNACLSLAMLWQADARYGAQQAATAQAIQYFQRVIAEFGKITRGGVPLAELAKPELYDLQHLCVGQPAPVTEGHDFSGEALRLSDYQGQIVILSFWGQCGGCRPDMQKMRQLFEKFQGKPIAILGVFCDNDVKKGKSIADELGMNWPSFFDGRSGPISRAWNNEAWPVFQVIDGRGIIRARHVHDGELARVLGPLVGE